MSSRWLALLLLAGCGFAAAERRAPNAEMIVRNPASGQILLFGSGPDYEAFIARIENGRVVDRRELPAQRIGNLQGVWISPSGKIRLANETGEDFEILESADGREWSYPRVFRGTFGSFSDDGSFSYLHGPSNMRQPLHLVTPEGEDREVALGDEEQTPAVCGEVVMSSAGYEMRRIELREGEPAITDRWEIDGRNQGFLPAADQMVVTGLVGVFRLRAGNPEPELVRKHRSADYGALASLAVDGDGNIIYTREDEGAFEFFGADGTALTLPLGPELRGPAGGGSIYRCRSNAFLREGDRLWVAQGTVAMIGIRDGSVAFIPVE